MEALENAFELGRELRELNLSSLWVAGFWGVGMPDLQLGRRFPAPNLEPTRPATLKTARSA